MAYYEARYDSDDFEVTFQADMIVTDLGVPNSTHEVIDDNTIRIVNLAILGKDIDFGSLPNTLQCLIWDLQYECEWVKEY